MKFIEMIQKYWWLLVVCGGSLLGFLVVWSSIPTRLSSAEEQIDDLKGWARELQGYTRAQEELNQQAPAQGRLMATKDPEIYLFDDGQTLWCTDGRTSWVWQDKKGCRR